MQNNDEALQTTVTRMDALIDTYDITAWHPNSCLQFYYAVATTAALRQDEVLCERYLTRYVTVATTSLFPICLKSKIKDRPDLGKDERYGRRVVFELNKAYPVLMSPLLTVEELEREVIKALSLYYDLSQLPMNQS